MDSAFQYFSEVVRLGSVRQAAERLHVSASSISRQIAKLEHAFGVTLVVRHSQGVKLTAAGEVFARFLQSRSRELLRLKFEIDALKGLQRGHVSIITVEGMIAGVLPVALAEFSRQHPNMTYEVSVAGTDDVMEAVAEDRCDVGISFHPRPRPDVDMMARICQPMLAVMSPAHRLAKREALEMADLVEEPLGFPDRSFGIRHLLDHVVKSEQLQVTVRLETNSIDMLRQFALHQLGVVFLPAFAFERELAAGSLVGVAITNASLANAAMQICKRANFELSLPASRFVDIMLGSAQLSGVASDATRRAKASSC